MSKATEHIPLLVKEMERVDLILPEDSTYEQILVKLSEYINYLIDTDFSKLVLLLYRLDISEEKLRSSIDAATDMPAAATISALIIERQLQKIETRKAFKRADNIPEDEKW